MQDCVRATCNGLTLDNEFTQFKVTLHETGHQFGLDEYPNEMLGCVMAQGAITTPVFCPGQIRLIRMTSVPSISEL